MRCTKVYKFIHSMFLLDCLRWVLVLMERERERMIFGKEATFVLNILPAKIHKVKPETKKKEKGETISWMNLSMLQFLRKFQLKAVSCGLLTRKLPMKEEAPGKSVKQSSTPLQMIRRKEATERGIKIWGGGGGATFNDDPKMLWSFSCFPCQNSLGACWIHEVIFGWVV